jgi:Rps23 Pro-64 3,4-dihydroxylase Tpa1-like proline 4-hydroxylase
MRLLRLNSRLDAHALSKRFAEAGRLQIEDFLEPPDVKELAESLNALDWRLVLNSGARHVDLSAAQLGTMEPARQAAILKEVKKNAAHGFQYLYENWPVTDIAEAGELDHPMLKAVYDTLNGEAVRGFLQKVTGEATDFCDMQATRYSAGHFLTIHSDDQPDKNRKLAYVLGLTDGWSPTWGGQLQFLDARGGVTRCFVPRFNALSVFKVPTPHHVSQVSNFASKGRVSLTGWFRAKA